jgi:uncharacterized protein (TIGR03435 family)
LAVIILFLFMEPLNAQNGAKPSFEVASIKPTDSCFEKMPGGIMFTPPTFDGGRYKGCNSLKKYMEEAYQTEYAMIEGGLDWTSNASYRIEARTDPSTNKEQMRLMLQSLLEERFKLRIHRTPKEMQIFSLSVVEDGPKLLPAKLDENGNVVASSPEAPPEIEKAVTGKRKVDWRLLPQLFGYGDTADGQMEFFATAISISRFAEWLSNVDVTGRKVIDKTGLAGLYDFRFKYANPNLNQKNADIGNSLPEPSGTSLFKAIQEELGLKLEPGKSTFEYIVVDSAEKPSGN